MSGRARGSHPVFGDFQTPIDLARRVWSAINLDGIHGVIEPTVGTGAFIKAAPTAVRDVAWRCFDINQTYVSETRSLIRRLGMNTSTVDQFDVFQLAPAKLASLPRDRPVLAIGNPPWVTSAGQAGATRRNLPVKTNEGFELAGLDALTGRANFDVAEAILLRLLEALRDFRDVRLAFLIKRSVAMRLSARLLGRAEALSFSRIDAQRWFGASVDAGLYLVRVKQLASARVMHVDIADDLGAVPIRRAGVRDGTFIDDLDALDQAASYLADSPVQWRQGVKHDLARVLELRPGVDGGVVNGLGEQIDIEPDVLVPLYKGSDVANVREPSRLFPLYQVDLTGPSPQLPRKWPKLAEYLSAHSEAFAARRSRIYNGKHPFALFGVGPYLLAPWKVAVCGFYRKPRFRVLGPSDGQPPVVDDTCYLLPYADEESARTVAEHLNSAGPQQLIASLADRYAKRPFTKAVLSRVGVPVQPSDSQLRLTDEAA